LPYLGGGSQRRWDVDNTQGSERVGDGGRLGTIRSQHSRNTQMSYPRAGAQWSIQHTFWSAVNTAGGGLGAVSKSAKSSSSVGAEITGTIDADVTVGSATGSEDRPAKTRDENGDGTGGAEGAMRADDCKEHEESTNLKNDRTDSECDKTHTSTDETFTTVDATTSAGVGDATGPAKSAKSSSSSNLSVVDETRVLCGKHAVGSKERGKVGGSIGVDAGVNSPNKPSRADGSTRRRGGPDACETDENMIKRPRHNKKTRC
jgi:hypothetical protein